MATGLINKNMVLLWENPNIPAKFAAQTIPLDLSSYEFVVIVGGSWKGTLSDIIIMCGIGDKCTLRAAANVNAYRSITVNANGIQCNDCMQIPQYESTNTTVENNRCVPIKIYGIKV